MPGTRTAHTRELDRYIGSRLREQRLLLGMTQGELAQKLGLASQQVQKYESGVDRVSASRLFDCAIALGVPFGWFVEVAASTLGHFAFSRHPGDLALQRAISQITEPDCRTALKNLARVLAKSPIGRAQRVLPRGRSRATSLRSRPFSE